MAVTSSAASRVRRSKRSPTECRYFTQLGEFSKTYNLTNLSISLIKFSYSQLCSPTRLPNMIKSLFALPTLLTATTLTLVASTFVESAQAVSLQWSFQNAVFEDGGTLTGSFNYDADTNTYSNINISVSGSVNTPEGLFHFQPITYQTSTNCSSPPGYDWSCFFGATSTQFQVEHYWSPTLPDRHIALFFSQPLTNAGGTITLLGFSEGYRDAQIPNGADDDLVWLRLQNSEQVAQLVAQPSVAAVPEPSNIAGLALAGILGTAQLLRRKQEQMS